MYIGLCQLVNDCGYQKKRENQRGAIVALQCAKLAGLNISQHSFSCMFQVRLDHKGDSHERSGG